MKTEEAVIERINELCINRDISLSKLAYLAAIPPSTLKNIVYGKSKNTGIVTIAKICNGLDLELKERVCKYLLEYGNIKIFITHDSDLIKMCDAVYNIREGEIIRS